MIIDQDISFWQKEVIGGPRTIPISQQNPGKFVSNHSNNKEQIIRLIKYLKTPRPMEGTELDDKISIMVTNMVRNLTNDHKIKAGNFRCFLGFFFHGDWKTECVRVFTNNDGPNLIIWTPTKIHVFPSYCKKKIMMDWEAAARLDPGVDQGDYHYPDTICTGTVRMFNDNGKYPLDRQLKVIPNFPTKSYVDVPE